VCGKELLATLVPARGAERETGLVGNTQQLSTFSNIRRNTRGWRFEQCSLSTQVSSFLFVVVGLFICVTVCHTVCITTAFCFVG
jgi:hypothetical protein